MAFDFEPDLGDSEAQPEKKFEQEKEPESKKEELNISQSEASLVLDGAVSQDVVTVNNLLGLTQSHIDDDIECRNVVRDLTEELNNSIHLMSIKEILEYLKIKIREREFHVQCIFKAYDFIQKSEYAREAFIGNHRKEKIIQASDRSRINGLLSILNS